MTIPALAQAYVDSPAFVWMDNGRPLRTLHDYGYTKKIGCVQHVTGGGTLSGLDAYFRFEQAEAPKGSAQLGIGRHLWGHLPWAGVWIPIAETHQYMPLRRNADYPNGCSPWAQGAILRNSECPVQPSPTIAGMASGEPNGAFHSVENVAWDGTHGLTDPQFNANALMRAYLAGLDDYDITPATQLWHAEIDQYWRCFDPGWPGDLEDRLQQAARAILYENSPRLLRALEPIEGAPQPEPTPPPGPQPLSEEAKLAFSYAEGWASYARNGGPWEQCLNEIRAWTNEAERLARS